jgi:hypothetical protein
MQPNEPFDEEDYTPFISAPLFSHGYVKFYWERIEPQLISILENAGIEYFFTLTQLDVPTNSEILVAPLIVVYTTLSGVDKAKTSLDQIWDPHDFSEYLSCVHCTLVDCVADTVYQNVPFDFNMCSAPRENRKCGISIGFYNKSATSVAILESPSKELYAALTSARLFYPR